MYLKNYMDDLQSQFECMDYIWRMYEETNEFEKLLIRAQEALKKIS